MSEDEPPRVEYALKFELIDFVRCARVGWETRSFAQFQPGIGELVFCPPIGDFHVALTCGRYFILIVVSRALSILKARSDLR